VALSTFFFLVYARFTMYRFVDGSMGFVSGVYTSKKGNMKPVEYVFIRVFAPIDCMIFIVFLQLCHQTTIACIHCS
jgi:hypothetical protein